MKSQSYMTRALRARDPRFALILGSLGYGRRDMVTAEPVGALVVSAPSNEAPASEAEVTDGTESPATGPTAGADPLDHDGGGHKGGSKPAEHGDQLTALRAEYQTVLGKKPFHGWDAEILKDKIAAASA